MEIQDKAIALFKYIRELHALRYRIVTDVDRQPWALYLQDVPNDSDNVSLFYRDRVEEEADDDSALLVVKKPDFQRCPEPPPSLLEWLEPGWDSFTQAVRIKERILRSLDDEGEEEYENFTDSPELLAAFNKWGVQRAAWVAKQRVISRTRRFFVELFKVYTDLEREPETLELMIGNGIVNTIAGESRDSSVNHPLLLKRVRFKFDAAANVISIHDAESEPELYTLLLQNIQEINHGVIQKLQDDLREKYYHPLDRNDSPDFLKTLIHQLSPHSQFVDDTATYRPNAEDKLIMTMQPVFFVRKRLDGTLKALDEIITHITEAGYVPGPLVDLISGGKVEIPEDQREPSIEEQLAATGGESMSILLSKEANKEQLEIAERLEYYNAVLVQGPPGTGKTHTIANLLGHFLAQGKSVLVTSYTQKALAVLKEKVEPEIQDLCVSMLGHTNHDMVNSVDGITEFMSRHTANELKKQVEANKRQRAEIMKELAAVRKRIYSIKYREFEPIVYNGDSYSPAKAAAFVNANAESLSYIPGEVELYRPLPLTREQLLQLYQTNGELSGDEERALGYSIPSPDILPSPREFATAVNQYAESMAAIDRIAQQLNQQVEFDLENATLGVNDGFTLTPLMQEIDEASLVALSRYIGTVKELAGWETYAVVDGRKGGGYRQRWEMLISSIEDTATFADTFVAQMTGRSIVINPEIETADLTVHLENLLQLFRKKGNGKVGKRHFFLKPRLRCVWEGITINGSLLASEADCVLVMQYLSLLGKRQQTALLWNDLLAKQGAPEFFALDGEPERIGVQLIPTIRRYLDWYQCEYPELLTLMKQAGLNSERVFPTGEFDSELVQTVKLFNTIQTILPCYVELAKQLLTLSAIHKQITKTTSVLTEGVRQQALVCRQLIGAIASSSAEDYEKYYLQLSELHLKYVLQRAREQSLTAIEAVAPAWAAAIRQRIGVHGLSTCPENIESAWQWKQFAGIIDSLIALPFEELQYESVELSKHLRRMTAVLAANSAWYHLLLRTEQDLDMKQALQGWKLTVKKIGKGTGKNAPTLKKRARELMAKCQQAVPAWIMTINQAMDNLNPARHSFDVVIVDEASQADVSALGILYMAKQVIIVGDDKQVSPMAVGLDINRMNALRDMYIKEEIPNWHLFDAKTSLYDLAGTTFQPLMLREHFRCLPSIIDYSNRLSYDYKIKPLRSADTSKIPPAVVPFRVDEGRREGRQKINIKEAETIVSLMLACMEQEEYGGMTFGAISLLGEEQAQRIQQILLQRVDPADIEERRILCGNASNFQGDERDVVFLSLVDSNEGDGPLAMAGEGADDSRKQRYNVAASRAKDQLWVVHSLDYTRDLKNGDLRRDLIEYACNPSAFAQVVERIEAESESPFEEAIAKSLAAAGYNLKQQWQVGAYRIDMVVSYKGKSIAIECDGESYHSGAEKVRADMERQAVLERTGWRFIRIRSSEYFRNPELTMQKVMGELNNLGIWPEKNEDQPAVEQAGELLNRVKLRAAQIMDEWSIEKGEFAEGEVEAPTLELPVEEERPKAIQEAKQLPEQMALPLPSSLAQGPLRQAEAGVEYLTIRGLEKELQDDMLSALSAIRKSLEIGREEVDKMPAQEKTFLGELEAAGIDYIDNRAQSGIVWIPLANVSREKVEDIITAFDVRASFERRGAIATGNRAAWGIMLD